MSNDAILKIKEYVTRAQNVSGQSLTLLQPPSEWPLLRPDHHLWRQTVEGSKEHLVDPVGVLPQTPQWELQGTHLSTHERPSAKPQGISNSLQLHRKQTPSLSTSLPIIQPFSLLWFTTFTISHSARTKIDRPVSTLLTTCTSTPSRTNLMSRTSAPSQNSALGRLATRRPDSIATPTSSTRFVR